MTRHSSDLSNNPIINSTWYCFLFPQTHYQGDWAGSQPEVTKQSRPLPTPDYLRIYLQRQLIYLRYIHEQHLSNSLPSLGSHTLKAIMDISPTPSSQSTAPDCEVRPLLHSSTGIRVLQACNSWYVGCLTRAQHATTMPSRGVLTIFNSRRRKTKCSGTRPTCSACILRRLPCSWPTTATINHIASPSRGSAAAVINSQSSTTAAAASCEEPRAKRQRLSQAKRSEGTSHLSILLLRRALDIFYERHFTVEFCSFLHVPSIDVEILRQRSPFFAHALIALSGLYFSEEEAVEHGFATAEALSEWHATVAREYSRQSVDSPSSTRNHPNPCYLIPNIAFTHTTNKDA